MKARDALDRTLLISRGILGRGPMIDDEVLRQLTSTRVALVADERNLANSSGQSALVTLAGLLLAQGMRLVLVMPDVEITGYQPPLQGKGLRRALIELAADSIPGCVAQPGNAADADLVFVLGDTKLAGHVPQAWRLTGGEWWGGTAALTDPATRWTCALPIGAGVAAAIASIEPYKFAMRSVVQRLGIEAPCPELLEAVLCATFSFGGDVQPWDGLDLGEVDLISGGAITTSALHVLHRVPGLRMRGRVIEPQTLDLSNLNRYPIARRRDVGEPKTRVFTQWNTAQVEITGVISPYSNETRSQLAPLAPSVVVGADEVPVRWLVQSQRPMWLAIGATADFQTLTSEHVPSEPCAGCLHPVDDEVNDTIPTLSTVSYWAGLLVAGRLLRAALGVRYPSSAQALNLWPLRLDLPTAVAWQPVHRHPNCPVCSDSCQQQH